MKSKTDKENIKMKMAICFLVKPFKKLVTHSGIGKLVVDEPPYYFAMQLCKLTLPLVVQIGSSVLLRHEDGVLASHSVE
jgi:hypothetical protein